MTPTCPPITKDLLDHLKESFRTASDLPLTEATPWEYGCRAGIQKVLRYLENRYGDQQKGPVPNVFQQAKDS